MHHNRATSVCLIGIGGVGKTALATWAVKNAYKNEEYDYIVSISAKGRELTASGIQSISQKLTSLDDLLNAIFEVMGFPEFISDTLEAKKAAAIQLMDGEKVLLFIDNLETTVDREIIEFISYLPEPVKAIITSRRNVISISSYPIEIGPLESQEVLSYIDSLCALPKFSYCRSLSKSEKEHIGSVLNGIPLAIKWTLSKNETSDELLAKVRLMETSGIKNEEILEFSFRRVFEQMSSIEKSIMRVLAVVSDLPIEAIIQGCAAKSDSSSVIDALESLVADTIIIHYYDAETRSDKYRLLTLTQKFILNTCVTANDESEIHKRLSRWYNADDIRDPAEKQLISAMRQGGKNMGNTLVTFAETAAKRGDCDTAVKFFDAAITRDPTNWKVYWKYGEYYRHHEKATSQAITMYESALTYADKEKMTSEIAIMNREFGKIYGSSGRPDAIARSIRHLEIAHENMPHDPICANMLASMYEKKGYTNKIISLLEPFLQSSEHRTKEILWPMLLSAYEQDPIKYMVQITSLKDKLKCKA